MFNNAVRRLGFACKLIDNPSQMDSIKPKDECKKYNTGTTTVAWLNRQSVSAAEDKLWTLMKDNIESLRLLVGKVGTFEPSLRMARLSSEVLPVYTEPKWRYFYKQSDVIAYAERHFATVGQLARDLDVRLSFHPGQFCVLGSDREEIVNSSIEEFEYHADMARWMGFGKQFQDYKINVHIAGRAGAEGVRRSYAKLSPEARNTITIENEEISHGLDTCLTLGDLLPIVLDIHHNWVREGEYIETTDSRVKRVVDSWRGVRPVIHYSVSREDYLAGHPNNVRPSRDALISGGLNKQQLRAHSDFYHNRAVNEWAVSFLEVSDIMCESKAKNLASFELAKQAKELGFL
jgi:UV DNA damage repair endonuclease